MGSFSFHIAWLKGSFHLSAILFKSFEPGMKAVAMQVY
jgi:hypothetical protein